MIIEADKNEVSYLHLYFMSGRVADGLSCSLCMFFFVRAAARGVDVEPKNLDIVDGGAEPEPLTLYIFL